MIHLGGKGDRIEGGGKVNRGSLGITKRKAFSLPSFCDPQVGVSGREGMAVCSV